MNAINGAFTAVFNLLLAPLEALGKEFALIMVSGIFGILALIIFKQISSQEGIRRTKDQIKAHMIEIRIYQDDLVLVSQAIGKVLLRNFQYLAFNFGPILPLLVPFTFVAAQLVTRYAFEPVEVTAESAQLAPGAGLMLRVEFSEGKEALASGLKVSYPDGVKAISPLVRVPQAGKAYQEFVATAAGTHTITLELADGTKHEKTLVAGDTEARLMQPSRVQGILSASLWPAEGTLASDGPFSLIAFEYPRSELGWLPFSGELGVLLIFLIASMAFGAAVLKPLGIAI
ncbi:MAG: hypothetical protein ACI841_002139 [Planctomycetota bacterium]|jgi:hypothetical protein